MFRERNLGCPLALLSGCCATLLLMSLPLSLLVSAGLLFLTGLILQERQAVRYPEAEPVSGFTDYTIRPFYIRSKRLYRSPDRFTDVQRWYEARFEQPALERDMASGCVVLEKTNEQSLVEHYVFITICQNVDELKVSTLYSTSLDLGPSPE